MKKVITIVWAIILFIGVETAMASPKEDKLCQLTVQYIFENGAVAAPPYEAILVRDAEFRVDPPDIEGYVPAREEISEIISHNQGYTVIYYPEAKDAQTMGDYWAVYYKQENGEWVAIGVSEEKTRPIGTTLDLEMVTQDLGERWLEAMQPEGYVRVQVRYGTVGQEREAVQVYYKAEPEPAHYVKINYLDMKTGKALRDPWMDKLKEGEAYDLSGKAVDTLSGYELAKWEGALSGTVGNKDVEVNAYYTMKEYTFQGDIYPMGLQELAQISLIPDEHGDAMLADARLGSGQTKSQVFQEKNGEALAQTYVQKKVGLESRQTGIWTCIGVIVICTGIVYGIVLKVKHRRGRRRSLNKS